MRHATTYTNFTQYRNDFCFVWLVLIACLPLLYDDIVDVRLDNDIAKKRSVDWHGTRTQNIGFYYNFWRILREVSYFRILLRTCFTVNIFCAY